MGSERGAENDRIGPGMRARNAVCRRIYINFFTPFTFVYHFISFLRQNHNTYTTLLRAEKDFVPFAAAATGYERRARGETFAVTTTTGVTQRTCGERSDILLRCAAAFSLFRARHLFMIYVHVHIPCIPGTRNN